MEFAKEIIFPERLGRLNFFVRSLVLNFYIVWMISVFEGAVLPASTGIVIAVGSMAVVIYGVFFIYRPRARDCGLPAWTLIFGLVPYVSGLYSLILAFGVSESPLHQHTDLDDEKDEPRVSNTAGALCSICGTKLGLASDGIAIASRTVVCNHCLASTR